MKTERQKIFRIISGILLAVILIGAPVVFVMDAVRPYYQVFTLYTWNASGGDLTKLTLDRRFFIQIYMSSNKDEYALMMTPSIYTEESAKEAGDENLVGQFNLLAPPVFTPLYVFRDEEKYGRLRFVLYDEFEEAETGDIGIGIIFQLNCHIVKNKYLVPDKDNPYIYISPEDFAGGVRHDPISENIYPQKFAVKTLLEQQNVLENTTKIGLYQFYGYEYKYDESGKVISAGYEPSYVEADYPEQLYLESGKVYDGAKRKEGYAGRFEPVGDSFGTYSFIKTYNLSFSNDFLRLYLPGNPTADIRYLYFQSYLFNAPTEIKRSMISSTFFFNDTSKVYYDKNLTMIKAIEEILKAGN